MVANFVPQTIKSMGWATPLIQQGREEYMAVLKELPPALCLTATRCLNERLGRGMNQPHIGEFAPWLFADIFRVSSGQRLRDTVKGWLAIYFSVLLIDDIIDGELPSDYREQMLVISLLQHKGSMLIASASPRPLHVLKVLDSTLNETATTVLCELARQNHKIIPFSQHDIGRIGKKGAYLRVCFEAIADLSPHKQLAKDVWPVFDCLLTVLHLLDDITDWKSDSEQGRMTFPLTLAAENITTKKGGSYLKDGVLLDLITSGGLENTLKVAANYLKLASAGTLSHTNLHLANVSSYTEALTASVQIALLASRKARLKVQNMRKRAGADQPLKIQRVLADLQHDMLVVSQTT